MNKFLLDVWHDLWQTKLLPVAVLLGVALIVTPIFLVESAPEGSTTMGSAPKPAPSGPAGASVQFQDAAERRSSDLSVYAERDPFGRGPTSSAGVSDKAQEALADLGEAVGAGSNLSGSALQDPASFSSTGGSGGSADAAGSGGGGAGAGGSADPPRGSDDSKPEDDPEFEPPSGPTPGTEPGSGASPAPEASGSEDASKEERGSNDDDDDGDDSSSDGDRPDRLYRYAADLRFGTEGSTETFENVKRFLMLPPDSDDPLAVFLGVTDDGSEAVFLIDARAVPSTGGQGRCEPTPEECSFLFLRDGEQATLRADDEDYVLRLLDIELVEVTAESKNLRVRTSQRRSLPDRGSRAARRDSSAARNKRRSSAQRDPFGFPDFGSLLRPFARR